MLRDNESLKRSNAQGYETLSLGKNALSELYQQRELLKVSKYVNNVIFKTEILIGLFYTLCEIWSKSFLFFLFSIRFFHLHAFFSFIHSPLKKKLVFSTQIIWYCKSNWIKSNCYKIHRD